MKKTLNFMLILTMTFYICFSQEKTTIAVYNLRSTSILTQEEVEILTNHLRSILINYKKYDCLDRNMMDEILKEQGFQQSGCTNERCIVEAGQLLGVQKMLSGSVGKFGKLFTIELQIIDITTSKIEKSSTYYYEGEMEQLLTEGIKLSLEKLIGTKPELILDQKEPVELSSEPAIIKQEPEYGHITLKIKPSDATVKIDNKRIPSHNLDDYKISIGTYDLQISKRGYKTYFDVISVKPGDKLIIEKTLVLEKKQDEISHTFSPISLYLNGGFIEPWGNPGTGVLFNMGNRIQCGIQLSFGNIIKSTKILEPLSVEIMVGYASFSAKEYLLGNYHDGETNLISIITLSRYDLTDLILSSIGVKNPAFGVFGVAGIQYNNQSWDFPNWDREFDSASSFGLNLGIGVKYNFRHLIDKPIEIDMRFTQGVFILNDVVDQVGEPMFSGNYQHTENGILFGIRYPL